MPPACYQAPIITKPVNKDVIIKRCVMLASFTFCLITFSEVCMFDKILFLLLWHCRFNPICVENKLHIVCRSCFHYSRTKPQAVFTAKFSLLRSLACWNKMPSFGSVSLYCTTALGFKGRKRPLWCQLRLFCVSKASDRVHLFRYMRKHVNSVCTSALVWIAGLEHWWLTKSLISPALGGIYWFLVVSFRAMTTDYWTLWNGHKTFCTFHCFSRFQCLFKCDCKRQSDVHTRLLKIIGVCLKVKSLAEMLKCFCKAWESSCMDI